MRILTLFFLLVVVSCGRNQPVEIPQGVPVGAVLVDYPNESGMKRAIWKSGNILLEEGDIFNNQKHGSWMTYYPKGQVKSISTYLEGVKQGFEILFDNSGYMTVKSLYSNNDLEGEQLVFKRGVIYERRPYQNGDLHGTLLKYYPDGKVMEESNYSNGIIDGVAKWYDQNGNLTIEYTYENGVLVEN